eukprot:TRINITY_DN5588_c0_g2_i2.p1 TRINITY_DN5588_c0_g2~~TRINITY_DN5588_c0_g2_i2.p1  ORF type:complete len:645 (+),score=58.64 TRINITY_DN5588_c0_g2_i2:80-1936(+)
MSISGRLLEVEQRLLVRWAYLQIRTCTSFARYDPLDRPEASIVRKLGLDILHDPVYNKGTAFPHAERERLKLRGLLPPRVLTPDMQEKRFTDDYDHGVKLLQPKEVGDSDITTEMIRKWQLLRALQDRNETLFYKAVMQRFVEMAPIIYTPTVGWACLNYHRLYQKPRGMYFSSRDQGHMGSMVWNWPAKEVDAIVVTDGSRVLGLGDLGANGIGISIGKLDLYVSGGGFHPGRVLPCVVDVGTNNELLRSDPLYLGLLHPRIEGQAFFDLMDEFVTAVMSRWPKAILQFEDFSFYNAMPLLQRYRDHHLVFNDDIQGTAATAVAGIYGALRALGQPTSSIVNHRFVIVGAGSAGTGVASFISKGIVKNGVEQEKANANIWMLDAKGLITKKRENLANMQRAFARNDAESLDGENLVSCIQRVTPTVLIGLAGAGRLFTPEVLSLMSSINERPVIMAMSNPTSKMECTAQEAWQYTNGRAIFAGGSPQQNVTIGDQVMIANQANNMYIFPGLAIGAFLGETSTISDTMILRAAEVLPDMILEEDRKNGAIYPKLFNIRSISLHIACEVIKMAAEEGRLQGEARKNLARGEDALRHFIHKKMFVPGYTSLVHLPQGVME